MAEPHAHSQPIETYGLAPHNRNIWPSTTQYKHMAHSQPIETYGRHAWPILLFGVVAVLYTLLSLHLISYSPTEQYPSLHHVFGMTYTTRTPHHLFVSTTVIANHNTSSSSSIRHPP